MAKPENKSAKPAPTPEAKAPQGPKIQAEQRIKMSPKLMFPIAGAGTATNVVTTQMIAAKTAHVVIFFVCFFKINTLYYYRHYDMGGIFAVYCNNYTVE